MSLASDLPLVLILVLVLPLRCVTEATTTTRVCASHRISAIIPTHTHTHTNRQKHPKAYGVLVGESGRERGTKSARKQIKVDDVIDQATAAVRSGERVGTKRCNGAGRRRENLLQKGVEFCAKNLLPLDVIDSKGFKTFTAFLSRTVKKSDDLEAPSLPEDRNACLEQLSRAVVQRMKQSIAEKRQQYYQGVPFLRIVVEPDFVPYPLVRIVCYDEAGEPHEMNYVTSSEELTNLCLAPAKTAAYAKAVEVTVKDVLGDELASVWENAVSIEVYSSEGLVGQTPYPVIGGRTDKGKVDLETILRYVDPTVIWSADDRPSMEEHLVNLFRSLPSAEVDLETTLKRLAEEFDRYASTRDAMQRGRADWRTPGKLASRVTGYWESAHGEDTPLLRKLALSVRPLGEKEERRPLQSKRDIRTIESGDFLQPGDNFEKKNTQNTLMVKYN